MSEPFRYLHQVFLIKVALDDVFCRYYYLLIQDIELCSFIISTQEYAYQQGKLGAEDKHEYLTLIKIYETLSGKFYVKKGKAASKQKFRCLELRICGNNLELSGIYVY
jgi:hypothetical protein